MERRFFKSELRAEENGGRAFLTGTAANFGIMSRDLGGWREVLKVGAFDQAIEDPDFDCVALINHDDSRMLGRSTSGTLRVHADSDGLHYRVALPDTSYANDLRVLCTRHDLSESSFAFVVAPDGENWSTTKDPDTGEPIALRTVSAVSALYDVSVVTRPAYPQTSSGLSRSLPSSMPAEVRALIEHRDPGDDDPSVICGCECAACTSGACTRCDGEDCNDERCAATLRAAYADLKERCRSHSLDDLFDDDDDDDDDERMRRLILAEASF